MKLTNSQIRDLANAGLEYSTNHSLTAADGFKVFRLRKAVKEAYEALKEDELAIIKQSGIEDPKSFLDEYMRRAAIVKPTKEQRETFHNMDKQLEVSEPLRKELMKQEVDLGDIKPLSYESWYKLMDENKATNCGGIPRDIFSGKVESILENVFWLWPEE